jgi:hypothetical protein
MSIIAAELFSIQPGYASMTAELPTVRITRSHKYTVITDLRSNLTTTTARQISKGQEPVTEDHL